MQANQEGSESRSRVHPLTDFWVTHSVFFLDDAIRPMFIFTALWGQNHSVYARSLAVYPCCASQCSPYFCWVTAGHQTGILREGLSANFMNNPVRTPCLAGNWGLEEERGERSGCEQGHQLSPLPPLGCTAFQMISSQHPCTSAHQKHKKLGPKPESQSRMSWGELGRGGVGQWLEQDKDCGRHRERKNKERLDE